MGRAITEGLGAATGASGRAVEVSQTANLTRYKGLAVERLSTASGLRVPLGMADMIRTDLAVAGEKRGLLAKGTPQLRLRGEIIHYEDSSTVDTLIGPLEQVIVNVKLIDARSGKVVAAANLIGRARSSSASSSASISKGVGKALDQWLKVSGLKKAGEEEEKPR
jgi:hypothetical protein